MPKPFTVPDHDFDLLAQETQAAFAANLRRVDAFYQQTYPIILRECSRLSFDGSWQDFEQLKSCLLLVYSWMSPSRLDRVVRWPQYQSTHTMLYHMREDGALTPQNFEDVVQIANDSVVGASKFLHFIAPHHFPIWDQHVARSCEFWRRKQYNSPDVYVAYVEWLRARPISDDTVRLTADLLGVAPAGQQLRCKEFLLFQAGLKLKRARKASEPA
jgi:hypothetical protein